MDQYEKLGILGRGSYGVALLARPKGSKAPSHGDDASLLVIKETDLSQLTPAKRKETQNEADVLRSLSHVNVISYIATFLDSGKLYIVMEYADGGDLEAAIKRRKQAGGGGYFSERRVLSIFGQCTLGLQHTHVRHILHRDLKSQNIFLTKMGTVKLGDFGIAKALDHTTAKAQTRVGTPYYIAPEVCDNVEYGLKADIWSLGVVLYEMFALEPPFKADSLMSLVLKIINSNPKPLPDVYSREAREIPVMILQKNPERRPTCDVLVAIPVVRAALAALPACQSTSAPNTARRRSRSLKPEAASSPSPDRTPPPPSCVPGDPYSGFERLGHPVIEGDPYGGLSVDPADAVEELLLLLAEPEAGGQAGREPQQSQEAEAKAWRPERERSLGLGSAAADCAGRAAAMPERPPASRPVQDGPLVPRRRKERLPSLPLSQRSNSRASSLLTSRAQSARVSRAPSVDYGPLSSRRAAADDQLSPAPPPPTRCGLEAPAEASGEPPKSRGTEVSGADELCSSLTLKLAELAQLDLAVAPWETPSQPPSPRGAHPQAGFGVHPHPPSPSRKRRRAPRRSLAAMAGAAKAAELADGGSIGLDAMVALLTADPCSPLSKLLADPGTAERPRLGPSVGRGYHEARAEAPTLLKAEARAPEPEPSCAGYRVRGPGPALAPPALAPLPLAEACRRGPFGGRGAMGKVTSDGAMVSERSAQRSTPSGTCKEQPCFPALRLGSLGSLRKL